MRYLRPMIAVTTTLFYANSVLADNEMDTFKQQLNALQKDYEERIQMLNARLLKTEKNTQQVNTKVHQIDVKLKQKEFSPVISRAQNTFNPAISLILDGRYASFDNDPDDYKLPGFALGAESGLGEKGFTVGHTELVMSANIDDKFYGKMTIAIAEHEAEAEVELEEAFIQTQGLGNGLTVKAGRFFSEIGYQNVQHAHSWDFADAPLIYRGLFGNQLIDDGLQIIYVAPTDTFLQLGAEVLSGNRFPAGGQHNGAGAWTTFADIGGDIGIEHSWQLGLSYWQADDVVGRESGGHSHGNSAVEETPSFTGSSEINALDLVYKWSPNGNPRNKNFKFQFEYFDRKENGGVTMLNSGPPVETTSYDGHQKGWYVQVVYQFQSQWRAGLRHDQLNVNNTGSDADVLEEAGLSNEGHTAKRVSAMVEWLPSEFSRIRLQYNRDESYEKSDNQVFLQYTMSLGSHGAHQY
ncbi:MAG: outer membrane beta-barrel protein [Methylococcales bacterium]|nr:outer membrane beta-barrel protein [Methylococcales bacterium]MBT7410328.1 outer membrane beta-barrel protein [Methylococcales bacterium]